MKRLTLLIVCMAVIIFISAVEGIELEETRMPVDKPSVVLLMLDMAGQAYRCDSLLAHNRRVVGELLSAESLSKANVTNVYLGTFAETSEIRYSIPAGHEPDSIRYKKFARKVGETLNAMDKPSGSTANQSSGRAFARDVAGTLGYIRQFIEEQHLKTKYSKIFIVFASPFIQTLSPVQTHRYLQKNRISFPENSQLLVLGQAFNCQDVAQIERNIAYPKVLSYWSNVIDVKDFKFLTTY
ncbi:MAG: hypothetical protein HQK96_16330 [Nitrospirae bacterium]|nr:hypothetical protein [Nitrospirota bacterium]